MFMQIKAKVFKLLIVKIKQGGRKENGNKHKFNSKIVNYVIKSIPLNKYI